MSTFPAFSANNRRRLILKLLLTVLPAFIVLLLRVSFQSRSQEVHPERAQHPSQLLDGIQRFGDTESHLNTFAYDNNRLLARRAVHVDYDAYVCKGIIALDMITKKAPSTRVWTQQDIDNAWRIKPIVGRTSIDLDTALTELGIPHTERDVQATFADQDIPFTDQDGRPNVVSYNLNLNIINRTL